MLLILYMFLLRCSFCWGQFQCSWCAVPISSTAWRNFQTAYLCRVSVPGMRDWSVVYLVHMYDTAVKYVPQAEGTWRYEYVRLLTCSSSSHFTIAGDFRLIIHPFCAIELYSSTHTYTAAADSSPWNCMMNSYQLNNKQKQHFGSRYIAH